MAHDVLNKKIGRQPFTIFEMALDRCSNVYGKIPCNASLAAGSECYNTRNTCQDTANYNIFAIGCNGSSSYAYVSSMSAIVSGVVTVEAWVNINQHKDSNYVVAYNESGNGFLLYCDSSSHAKFAIVSAGVASAVTASAHPGDHLIKYHWHHVVGVYDGSTMRCFVNGKHGGSRTFAGRQFSKNGRLEISAQASANTMNGLIDGVKIYATALTTTEVNTLYHQKFIGSAITSTLIGNWTFHRVSSMVYDDYSGNANHATAVDTTVERGVPKIYRFCSNQSNVPGGFEMFPAIQGLPSFTPTRIKPGKGLSERGAFSIQLSDFVHHDRGIDPYASTRTYDTSQGTFFGKLLARNPYYVGRIMRVRTGYIDPDQGFSLYDFHNRHYTIDKIKGPDSRGRVTVMGKDILNLADKDRARIPLPSDGVLYAAVSANASTLYVNTSSIFGVYGSAGRIRIEDELVDYVSAESSTAYGIFKNCTRGVGGTTAIDHDISTLVQDCVVYSSVNVVDALYDILINYTDIPRGFIDKNQWDLVRDRWATQNLSGTIHEPEGVVDIIKEITEHFMIDLWWDDTNQLIKINVLAPATRSETVNDIVRNRHVLLDSLVIDDNDSERISQIWIYHGKRNLVDDDSSDNYKFIYVQTELGKEGKDQFGVKRVREIRSRWLTSQAQAISLGSRIIRNYENGAKTITFEVDDKDDNIELSSIFNIETGEQDVTGSAKLQQVQAIEAFEIVDREKHRIRAQVLNFSGRYAFIGPSTMVDYSSATTEEKERYSYIIASANASFADGSGAYKII